VILKGSKIVIPTKMRKEIVRKIHAARQVVFWAGMNSDIDNIVERCETCQQHQHNHQKEPLKAISSSNPSLASRRHRSL
jgi:hypothetical protein